MSDPGPLWNGLLVIALAIAGYFLPTILGRKKANFGAICALNVLLGWTVIGWIVALVWALTKDTTHTVVVRYDPKP